MRCVLAFSALLIIWIAPSEPQRLVALTYASLVFYCIYSMALVFVAGRREWPVPQRAVWWADVFFYSWLVALTEGTSSIFVFFYFFPMLTASFSMGFREGLSVTLVSVALFVTVGLIFALSGAEFELDRTLIRPVYLLVFGYMIARWGGHELLLRRRLRLLQEINSQWNPRLGVAHVIGENLNRLRAFFEGNACMLVLSRPASPQNHLMYSVAQQTPGQSMEPREISEHAARELSLPEAVGAACNGRTHPFYGARNECIGHDFHTQLALRPEPERCAAVASLLDTPSFMTVPFMQRDGVSGRIYVTSDSGRYSHSDILFLAQAAEAMATVVENMTLIERLIADAAELERLHISRDIHDTTIQPYIGLKLALDALYREAGDNPLNRRIGELIEMTASTISGLRDYTRQLKEKSPRPGEFLAVALRKQIEQLRRYYGIEVDFVNDIPPHLSGRVAAEVFQMIVEGISNILRHTSAKRAFVSVIHENSTLLLEIGNEVPQNSDYRPEFMPRSIHDRAVSLGGSSLAVRRADGYTVVRVTIPV